MSGATIHLDRPQGHFTNLDFITGRVVVNLSSETSIGDISVKLEGESRTRLAGPRHPNQPPQSEKKRTELEVHKILYRVVKVFPTPNLLQHGSPAAEYTFAPGTYEYPFQFKFPFNNACSTHNSMLTNLNIAGLKLEMAKDTNRHVKKTLPPSLGSFPGEAEIKYYVKVTIVRPQFYKENIRAFSTLNFLPIEPPRTGDPHEETYARRQHQFAKHPNTSKSKSLWKKVSSPSVADFPGEPPRLSADARLPNPSILTCNQPIPLRLLVKKLSATSETIFLQMLQIELITYTNIIAHDLKRTESGSFVILSRSNMGIPLGRGTDEVGTEWKVEPTMWNHTPLPNSVAPSFETCNISRAYELEVRIGLSHSNTGNVKPQLIVLPLRMPVKVYSGIAPPQALLDSMHPGQAKPTQPQPTQPSEAPQPTGPGRPPMPPRPAESAAPAAEEDDIAPPSYEDAMAEVLSPLDGPRHEYNPPAAPEEPGADDKSSVPPGPEHERDLETPYANPEANLSSDSFDMLPSTPPESQPDSPPPSPGPSHLSMLKRGNPSHPEGNPPRYSLAQAQAEGPSQMPQTSQWGRSRSGFRGMNLGVPNRKPVPRSSSSRGG